VQFKDLVKWQKMFGAHRVGKQLDQQLPSTEMDPLLDLVGY